MSRDSLRLTAHAQDRMDRRGIPLPALLGVLAAGKCLGLDRMGRCLHLELCGYRAVVDVPLATVVTVYERGERRMRG
ncbi:MAG: DUF4258 domain-containing protein [Desulfovibrio sp.]